jgi:hypothetical protein
VFWAVANGYASDLPDEFSATVFAGLLAGGLLSGLAGGVLLHVLLRPNALADAQR